MSGGAVIKNNECLNGDWKFTIELCLFFILWHINY